MALYWVESAFLIAAIATAVAGLGYGEKWAYESWVIPVLVALLWGTLQTKT